MNNSQVTSGRASTSPGHPGLRTVTQSVALPRTRPELLALHDLLESNLRALHALHQEHRRMLGASLRAAKDLPGELHDELRAIGNAGAPWVQALSETRALLYVALRELVVGANEAEQTMQLPQQKSA